MAELRNKQWIYWRRKGDFAWTLGRWRGPTDAEGLVRLDNGSMDDTVVDVTEIEWRIRECDKEAPDGE